MTLTPLLTAPLNIQIHASAALLAVALGPFVILRQRRDRLHKTAGYVWVSAMAVTALSSFTIWSFGVIGPFSPIHLLSILAVGSLWHGMRAAFRGDVAVHRASMEGLYWRGLLVAGALNFLPGRTMNRSLLGDQPQLGYAVIAACLGALALQWWMSRQPAQSGMAAE